jgi:hypothetical protein
MYPMILSRVLPVYFFKVAYGSGFKGKLEGSLIRGSSGEEGGDAGSKRRATIGFWRVFKFILEECKDELTWSEVV